MKKQRLIAGRHGILKDEKSYEIMARVEDNMTTKLVKQEEYIYENKGMVFARKWVGACFLQYDYLQKATSQWVKWIANPYPD